MEKNILEKNKSFKPFLFKMDELILSYAMSVIVSRALPDVRDGLKPSIEELFTQCIKEDMTGQNLLESLLE